MDNLFDRDSGRDGYYPQPEGVVEPSPAHPSREEQPKPKVALFIATRDGHSAHVAARLAETLRAKDLEVEERILSRHDDGVIRATLPRATMAILVAAVRYGRHLPEAVRFAISYRAVSSPPPFVMASVNLTARKPDRKTAQNNPYLRKFLARQRLNPVFAAAFAGRLDYPRYRWLDRQMIRLIMSMTGGPTDGTSTVEYTDWNEVEAFARQIAETARALPSASSPNGQPK